MNHSCPLNRRHFVIHIRRLPTLLPSICCSAICTCLVSIATQYVCSDHLPYVPDSGTIHISNTKRDQHTKYHHSPHDVSRIDKSNTRTESNHYHSWSRRFRIPPRRIFSYSRVSSPATHGTVSTICMPLALSSIHGLGIRYSRLYPAYTSPANRHPATSKIH